MFKNDFQGGAHFEVFSAQGKHPETHWKLTGSGIKKSFDKEVKSFVFTLEGSTSTTKMQLPKDPKQSLTLIQRFLVLQICVPKGQDFSIDLGVTDMGGVKRRLVFSTTYKETHTNPLHSKFPLALIKRGLWLNFSLDLHSLVGETWVGQTYKSLENICVSANCRLRRIFTMKAQPPDTTDDEETYGFSGTNIDVELETIPKQCQLAPDVPQETQVINVTKLMHFEGKVPSGDMTSRQSTEIDLNSSGGRKDGYHIAFGSKVQGAQPRKGSGKEGSATSRVPKSAHTRSRSDSGSEQLSTSRGLPPHPPKSDRVPDSSRVPETSRRHSSGRERKNSDPGANMEDDPEVSVDKESLRTSHTWTDGADNKQDIPFVKPPPGHRPHPPRIPSSEKTRRRPRVKSAGKERTPHSASYRDLSSANSSAQSSHNSSSTNLHQLAAQDRGSQPKMVADDDEVERIMQEMHDAARRDQAHSESESEPSSPQNMSGVIDEGDLSMTEVIQTLRDRNLVDDDPHAGDYEDSEEEDEVNHKIYMFSSAPKAAPRARHSSGGGGGSSLQNGPKKKKVPTATLR